MKILLVDDDAMIIKGLTSIIEKIGLHNITIYTARNGADALEILKYSGADLLLTDIDMPVMSGLELIEETIRRKHCNRFIILSGFDKFDFVRRALRFHVIDYLLKPIDKTELTRIVSSVYNEIHNILTDELRIPQFSSLNISIDENSIPNVLKDILRYMRSNFHRNISLEQLGEEFNLHPNYICSLFQSHTETTFLKYLDSLRLQESIAILLEDKELTIEKVAISSGFMSERQFYKVFKKYIGITPGALRSDYGISRLP
jgi:YesN/AraC family two-component response regulator